MTDRTRQLVNALRIIHNKSLNTYIVELRKRKDKAKLPLIEQFGAALRITSNDSLIEIQNKQLSFQSLRGSTQIPVASVPEWWSQRAGANIPQLAVIFRPPGKTSTYTMHIPHYRKSQRSPKIPSYTKGDWRGEWVLSDGSKFVCNAISESEANRMWRSVKQYIEPSFLKNVQDMSKPCNAKFNKVKVEPLYADFYGLGLKGMGADWRAYL
jgi:hypothetical protein